LANEQSPDCQMSHVRVLCPRWPPGSILKHSIPIHHRPHYFPFVFTGRKSHETDLPTAETQMWNTCLRVCHVVVMAPPPHRWLMSWDLQLGLLIKAFCQQCERMSILTLTLVIVLVHLGCHNRVTECVLKEQRLLSPGGHKSKVMVSAGCFLSSSLACMCRLRFVSSHRLPAVRHPPSLSFLPSPPPLLSLSPLSLSLCLPKQLR
jgi:hypothetical protein